ncbi:hypothetical protein [Crocosphaera sp.]|uniref:hypothetical protein n=1 Tax=Crocosphaera sp. TaxID=2729996 RepID=UPI00262EC5DE|nr:hypothetical protein [Crocosphaera sp.]MDJ0582722.1 hypothetical protein [Crocosphaera sp.]
MTSKLIDFQIPIDLYQKIQQLATEEQSDPVSLIEQLISNTYQRKSWLNDLAMLRQQIKKDGGLELGNTKEEMINNLHKTRQEIFEADYPLSIFHY